MDNEKSEANTHTSAENDLDAVNRMIAADAAASGIDLNSLEDSAGSQDTGGADNDVEALTNGSGDNNAAGQNERQDISADKSATGGASGEDDKAKKQDKDPKPKEEEKPLSNYEKAKAAAKEREARAWKKINEEKERLAQAARELEDRQRDTAQPASRYSADDYRASAERWETEADKLEAEGEFEKADEKRNLARLALKQAETLAKQGTPPTKAETDHETKLRLAQKAALQRAREEMPELTQKGSPLNEAVVGLLRANPGLLDTAEGPYWAAKYAQAESQASRVPDLEAEVSEFKAKIKELEEATSVGGASGPTAQPAQKAFEEMTLEEQERELAKMAG